MSCKKPKISEGDNVLQQQPRDQTMGSDCLDMFGPILKALDSLNEALTSQMEQRPMSCREDILTFKELSEKDEAEKPDSLVKKDNDVGVQEELKTSEGDDVLQQETSDLEKKLEAKLEALESHNKALSNEVVQLKMRYECMAEKYMAEKREKEALQNTVQELNIKLQNAKDLSTQQQLKASETEKILRQEIDDLRETLRKEREEDSKLQACEEEKKAYLQELEDTKLCYEGKTLRFHDMFEKLKAEKAHREAIKEEQFKKIQALHIKVRQQQDLLTQQKLRASEKEKMLSLKVEELEEKISRYEKAASSETDDSDEEVPGKQKRKRKGWKKVVDNIKPWHWGKT